MPEMKSLLKHKPYNPTDSYSSDTSVMPYVSFVSSDLSITDDKYPHDFGVILEKRYEAKRYSNPYNPHLDHTHRITFYTHLDEEEYNPIHLGNDIVMTISPDRSFVESFDDVLSQIPEETQEDVIAYLMEALKDNSPKILFRAKRSRGHKAQDRDGVIILLERKKDKEDQEVDPVALFGLEPEGYVPNVKYRDKGKEYILDTHGKIKGDFPYKYISKLKGNYPHMVEKMIAGYPSIDISGKPIYLGLFVGAEFQVPLEEIVEYLLHYKLRSIVDEGTLLDNFPRLVHPILHIRKVPIERRK